jgi:hypothetical protein
LTTVKKASFLSGYNFTSIPVYLIEGFFLVLAAYANRKVKSNFSLNGGLLCCREWPVNRTKGLFISKVVGAYK